VSFRVGFDDQKHDASKNGPIVAGAKAILVTERDICEADLHEVKDALRPAATRVAILARRIEDELYARYQQGAFAGVPRNLEKVDFLNAIRDAKTFSAVRKEVGERRSASSSPMTSCVSSSTWTKQRGARSTHSDNNRSCR